MVKNTRFAAHKYAKALLALAQKENAAGKVQNDLTVLVQSMRRADNHWEMLKNPIVRPQDKAQAVSAAFISRVEPSTLQLLLALTMRGELDYLPLIAERFEALSDEAVGLLRVSVRTAFPLTQEAASALQEKLSTRTGKKIVLEAKEDPGLIGGLLIKVGDRLFENSLRLELRQLNEALTGS
ncbi:MAG: ATP synthase F1 subunit delta [Elusimicrobia bacterium]|nr:ATP synthase F1 subunit delta [Elusimicrobiota bacterium]